LVISSIGFSPIERTVDGTTVNVTLQATEDRLSDVVVVGYGTQRRANVTGSVVTLRNEDLTRRQVASASNLLQGLAPGVTVQQQSGKPGADAANIVIRGQSSINLASTPLVVIDGLALDMTAFNQIDPNAIESVTVLKDAAATAIYGNRASTGVIVVRTKRATQRGLSLSYNNFFTKQEATAIPKRVSAIEHMELSNIAERNRSGNNTAFVYPQTLLDKYKSTPANNLDVINTDWLKEILTNSGFMQNHNVQLNSVSDQTNIFTSFSYLTQQGLIQNSNFERFDFRMNPEFKVNKMLTLSGTLGYTRNKTVNPSTGSAEFIIRQAIGLPAIGGGRYGDGMFGDAGQSNLRNPIAQAEATGRAVTSGNTLLTRFGFNFYPVSGLDIEAYWGREQRNPTTKTFIKNSSIFRPNVATQGYDKISDWPGSTRLSESWRNDVYQTLLGQATYSFKLGDDHNFKVLAGVQSEEFLNYFFSAARNGFINPNQPFLNLGQSGPENNAGAGELALLGLYSRLNYNYRGRYLLEVNGRRDASSRFSQALGNQWGNFASASVGWVFSNERFFSGLGRTINFGKLRGSYGGNGNQNTGNQTTNFYGFDAFYGTSVYNNPNNGTNAYFNNATTLGLALLQFANPELGWETSKQWNVGLDLTMLKKFTVTADYYVRTQKRLLLQRTLPASAGGLINPFINAGNMENRGWELSLNYKNRVGKWSFDLTGMLMDVKNEVQNLVEGTPFFGDGIRTAPGYALGSYFGYQAVGFFRDSNDVKSSPVQFGVPWNTSPTVGSKPGDLKYADISGPDGKPDGRIDNFDRTFLGNSFPRYEYSLNFNIGYGNFDLNILGQGVGMRNNYLSGTGAVPFNSSDFIASVLDIHKNYWRPDNQNADFPRLLPTGFGGNNYLLSSQWIRSAAYFRIKNVNLGYRLPETVLQRVKITSARVFIAGSNLATFSSAWKGFDPEINSANAEFYPLMRTWTAGVNINF
jgi:TonB-linked SusC/RagA family outer membrane protein